MRLGIEGVGIKIVKILVINLLTSIDPS
ncbi:hypothetical protein E2C01_072575 [Portunus trituberculatus]|uniref:Uncharacterized protein n=1 Tax=Portunus trituberculatus TaxID=210409 RepID=A0A5B7I9B3_PORTR|nr:hypothetical protein [Portunus trituberculatus]